MRRRDLLAISIAMSAMLAVGGCAGSSSEVADTTVATTTEEQTTEPITTTEEVTTEEETVKETESFTDYRTAVEVRSDYISDDYMDKSTALNKYADYSPVADVMKKAANGEKVTIVCIGGSITQGTISSGAKDNEVKDAVGRDYYANMVFDWWKKAFPDTEIECVNAGIGATGSYLGVHRVQKDVLDKKPDLVVVEFSVNDAGVKQNKVTYENLLRDIRRSEGNPAVVCLFMGMPSGGSAESTHQEPALYYNLPSVSYNNLMKLYLADKTYTSEELAGDGVHPTVLGHALTGELLWKLFNDIYAHKDVLEAAKPFDDTKDYLSSAKFVDCAIEDRLTITPTELGTFTDSSKSNVFPNDWTSEEGEGGLTFTATFKNLGIMYYKVTNGKGAKYDVYVDDIKVGTLNSDFKGGWGSYAESEEVYASEEEAEHTVTFKKAEDSVGEEFTVLGLLTSK